MDDQLKGNKLDILKVKQKVFNSYPANSIARKNMIAEEKKRDLQQLNTAVPNGVMDLAVAVGQQSIELIIKKLLLHIPCLALTAIILVFFASTTLEYLLFGGVLGFFIYKNLFYSWHLFLQIKALLVLKREFKKIREKAEKLKRDLFGK